MRAGDDDRGARLRQPARHAEADAAIAAGDDGDAPGKIERSHDNSPPARLPRALRRNSAANPLASATAGRAGSGVERRWRFRQQRRAVSSLSTTPRANAGVARRPDRDGVGHDRTDRRDG